MATNEKPVYTGIDKIDHFNQRHFEDAERERMVKIMLEEQAREAAELEQQEVELERSKKVILGGSPRGFTSFGVAALLAAMATEQLGRTVSRNPASKRTGKVRPHDGRVKRSTLTREDFPSRQAWRAHQREQEKAQRQGQLYD